MSSTFHAERLDVPRFSREGAELSGQDLLIKHERLISEALDPQASATRNTSLAWRALGELVEDASGHQEHWLHLTKLFRRLALEQQV